jgi:hypothetical protein
MKKKSLAHRVPASVLKAHEWKPGQSGNPGGRPRVVGALRDLAREHTQAALDALLSIMRDEAAPSAARVAAAVHVLDRGYGRPTQHVEAAVRAACDLSDQELLAIIAGAASEVETER